MVHLYIRIQLPLFTFHSTDNTPNLPRDKGRGTDKNRAMTATCQAWSRYHRAGTTGLTRRSRKESRTDEKLGAGRERV